MGTKGIEILGGNVEEIKTLLEKAYAEEWQAYYQYWLGAKVAKGPMREGVMAELNQHAADELRHAGMVADRLIQIGGTPALSPEKWYGLAECDYEEPSDPYVRVLLDQNIRGEQCAITTYKNILDVTKEKDFVTYNMVLQILQDEVEHEEDLQALLEDMDSMVARE
ncbi:MAG: ferritin-like domain-containing protein, partial [bacterium]